MCAQAPHGAIVRDTWADEPGDLTLVHKDGSLEAVTVPIVCHEYARQHSQTMSMRAQQRHQPLAARVDAPSMSALPDGWVESAGVYRMDPKKTISKFTV